MSNAEKTVHSNNNNVNANQTDETSIAASEIYDDLTNVL